jgi:hypothetical protein
MRRATKLLLGSSLALALGVWLIAFSNPEITEKIVLQKENIEPVQDSSLKQPVLEKIDASLNNQKNRRLLEFQSSPDLSKFIRESLLSKHSVDRFYADYAYMHCQRLQTLASSKISRSAVEGQQQLSEAQKHAVTLMNKEVERCSQVHTLYPDMRTFAALVSDARAVDDSFFPVNKGSIKIRGHSAAETTVLLRKAIDFGDPLLTAEFGTYLMAQPKLKLNGQVLDEQTKGVYMLLFYQLAYEKGLSFMGNPRFAASCIENSKECQPSILDAMLAVSNSEEQKQYIKSEYQTLSNATRYPNQYVFSVF